MFDGVELTEEFAIDLATYELSELIHGKMLTLGISRAELAKRMGANRTYITKLLGGGVECDLATIVRLARALNVELNFNDLFRHRNKTE